MKWIGICFIGFCLTLNCTAVGGVWVLEITYNIHGKANRGYLLADVGADSLEKFIGKDQLFRIAFNNYFAGSDSLNIYREIIDQELLARKASFAMHSFFLVDASLHRVEQASMRDLSLVKVWKKMAYDIDVLTQLNLRDTMWIGQKSTKDYPLGDEVGCRLAVHNFGKGKTYKKLLAQYLVLYRQNRENDSVPEKKAEAILLALLKKEKVVIVQLCGC